MKFFEAAVSAAALTAMAASASARELVINANTSDPAQKLAMEELIDAFETEYPEIEVVFNLYDHEAIKTAIRNFLVSDAPDIII